MNKQEQEAYKEKYKKAKEHGVPFFPDIIFKDTIVTLIVFLILIALVYFVGAPLEARANPNDTSYTPRPEWYFLFLFQMLKYFPGNLEVVGAMILPTLFIGLLLLLPFLDKSPKRHYRQRPVASVLAILVVAGIGALTYISATEAAPPKATQVVDQAAALYTKNCANCHGQSIVVPPGTDLHQLIATGNHQGMPAWGGDLSSDEIDMLAGFVMSPNGSALFTRECGSCHQKPILASGNPTQLQRVFDEGLNYPAHKSLKIPDWKTSLTAGEQTTLLNFLAAPDGQRLFAINCAGCHGQGVGVSSTKEELRKMIVDGGHEVTMPGWKGTLSTDDLDALASYVMDPKGNANGEKLFGQHCVSCHGDKVPASPSKESAVQTIALGGSHITMPVWGKILTAEQIDALTAYTWDTSKGTGAVSGAKLFASNCVGCHGKYGEGGPNPSFPGDMILPISSAEFLKTRDDATLRNIITQGQPTYGMSAFGGMLSSDQIDSLVAYIRIWQTNPPTVSAPKAPPAVFQPKELSAKNLYDGMCAQCHGANFEGGTGPALDAAKLRAKYDDQALFDLLNNGVLKVAMPGAGHMFSADQIKQLEVLIAGKDTGAPRAEATPAAGAGEPVSFKDQVLPIFQAKCSMCHNATMANGGWDASTYKSVTSSGSGKSAITAGDANNSPMIQLLMQTNGVLMPPSGSLSDDEIQIILNWINQGALDN